MERAGYHLLAASELRTKDDHEVALLELTAPVGELDYAYLVGLLVNEDASC